MGAGNGGVYVLLRLRILAGLSQVLCALFGALMDIHEFCASIFLSAQRALARQRYPRAMEGPRFAKPQTEAEGAIKTLIDRFTTRNRLRSLNRTFLSSESDWRDAERSLQAKGHESCK